jgi:hypothetical protein
LAKNSLAAASGGFAVAVVVVVVVVGGGGGATGRTLGPVYGITACDAELGGTTRTLYPPGIGRPQGARLSVSSVWKYA